MGCLKSRPRPDYREVLEKAWKKFLADNDIKVGVANSHKENDASKPQAWLSGGKSSGGSPGFVAQTTHDELHLQVLSDGPLGNLTVDQMWSGIGPVTVAEAFKHFDVVFNEDSSFLLKGSIGWWDPVRFEAEYHEACFPQKRGKFFPDGLVGGGEYYLKTASGYVGWYRECDGPATVHLVSDSPGLQVNFNRAAVREFEARRTALNIEEKERSQRKMDNIRKSIHHGVIGWAADYREEAIRDKYFSLCFDCLEGWHTKESYDEGYHPRCLVKFEKLSCFAIMTMFQGCEGYDLFDFRLEPQRDDGGYDTTFQLHPKTEEDYRAWETAFLQVFKTTKPELKLEPEKLAEKAKHITPLLQDQILSAQFSVQEGRLRVNCINLNGASILSEYLEGDKVEDLLKTILRTQKDVKHVGVFRNGNELPLFSKLPRDTNLVVRLGMLLSLECLAPDDDLAVQNTDSSTGIDGEFKKKRKKGKLVGTTSKSPTSKSPKSKKASAQKRRASREDEESTIDDATTPTAEEAECADSFPLPKVEEGIDQHRPGQGPESNENDQSHWVKSAAAHLPAALSQYCSQNLNDEEALAQRHPPERLADLLIDLASFSEPALTEFLTQWVDQFDGRLEGLEFKLKGRESLIRKINFFAKKHMDKATPDLPCSQEQGEEKVWRLHTSEPGSPGMTLIVDALRYTVVYPTDKYVEATAAMRERLTTSMFDKHMYKNFWIGEQPFRGINDNYEIPLSCGPCPWLIFEIQLHTHESFAAKGPSHDLYEEWRASQDQEEKDRLNKEMIKAAQLVPAPNGVLDLPAEVTLASRPYQPLSKR